MGARAVRLKLRLFLEGQEVPIIAIMTQSEANSPTAASIQIPAVPEAIRFMPKTLVHAYFLDFYEDDNPMIALRGKLHPKGDTNNPSVYEQKLQASEADMSLTGDDLRAQRYKLIFVGEVVGFQYTKAENKRSVVLQCQDLSNYWDTAQQWENTDLFGPGYKAMFSGGSTNLFTDFLSSKDEELIKKLLTPSVQFPALKGLLGGIIHLLEGIGGSYYGEKKFGGQNIFYSLAELRLHTTQMITAYDKDTSANNLLNANGYDSLFGRILGNLGDQVSFRAAITALMKVIFHETYPITTPAFIPGTFGTTSGVKRRKLRDDPNLAFIPNGADDTTAGLTDIQTTIKTAGSATSKPEVVKRLLAIRKTLTDLSTKARSLKVQDAPGIFSTCASLLGKVMGKVQGPWKPGGAQSVTNEIVDLLDQVKTQLARAARLDKVESNPKKAIPARLNTHIFRPDVWFAAPPRCNVLFPDQYTAVTYARNFLSEPTRLLLKTNDAFFGEDELFDQFYFAPKAVTTVTEKANLQAVLSGGLMDHELFTGILPVFEKMSETNIFAVRSGAVDGKMPKIGLAQRTTNFLYFKYRFASRQMTISARFNPYIVTGFPGLVIDSYVDQNRLDTYSRLVKAGQVSEREQRAQLGVHYLALFSGITHSLDQQTGGRTEISCGYARDYDESVEFLGAIEGDQTVQKKFGDALRDTDVAAMFQPPIGSLGPNFGIIKSVTDVTDAYLTDDETASSLPLYRGTRKAGKNQLQTRVQVGILKTASDFGSEVASLVSDPSQLVSFRAFRISEEVPKYRTEKIDLPAEEYIRPGWYGDAWNNGTVGRVYDEFFKIGSITDPTQIADPDGQSTGSSSNDLADAVAQAAAGQDPEDPRLAVPALLSLDEKSSISQAVAFLVLSYSYIRQNGLDIDEFIRAYTWRPIASMSDMFGSSDLELSANGFEVVKGIEGFHSRAFGPYDDLFGLVPPEIESILDIKAATKATRKNDTRKRKWDAVQDYVGAVQNKALLG